MLTILNELAKYRDEETGEFALDQFKIVYIAPMKALVQEMVGNFTSRLTSAFGVKISETQIIVTTPDKWDVITRKSTDTSYTNLVRLMIINEIYLLHDERGPVLESVVARGYLINNVAQLLRVDESKGLFYFDACVTEKKAIKRFQVMNEVCYEKLLDQAGKNQILVFVHSRKETAKTAKLIVSFSIAMSRMNPVCPTRLCYAGNSARGGGERQRICEYVRMLKSPGLYGVGVDYQEDDDGLVQKRANIVYSAAALLEKCHLIKYERSSGRFQSTELGRIASHYYVTHNSMATYNLHLRPTMSTLELIRVFALSNEFKLLPVRQEEKFELAKLLERVPIPVKESVDEPAAKINVLLQAYISQLKLEGFALVADMAFVQQSAGRILRAMLKFVSSEDGLYQPGRVLRCARWWGSMTPLRQFKGVPQEVIRKAEGKQFPWYRYFDLSPPELQKLVGIPNADASFTDSSTISPNYHEKIHGGAETFFILVEDVDGEIILFHDTFVLRQRYAEDEHSVTITVPMFEPVLPNYYIPVVSDRWLHAETRLPISFKHLILPERFPPPTPLLELQPLPLSALHNKDYEAIYSNTIQTFNKIQTQVFQALYTSDENVFVGAPTGSGRTICAEFALLKLWNKRDNSSAVCVGPYQEIVDHRVAEWRRKFSSVQYGKEISMGRFVAQMASKENCADDCPPYEVQLIGGEVGPTYEVIISRTRYVSAQTEIKTRVVACGVSLANARDLGEWIGAPSHAIFNFSPSSRPFDMDIHLQSFTIPRYPSLLIAMSKPAYLAIVEYAPTKPVIVFISHDANVA
ncbi:hypothetical protein JVT61DRAFT_15372 [Boletus reticuloceps]|uniref:SEC63 domain-containing protein n=1 Tax=Boletus reticuloceps TaxID=495285 RepID=A0A8I2YVU1_9AGAM|nr:hypothetical protein JVT61DRAFT_15372 [Boletus reticuloceps]